MVRSSLVIFVSSLLFFFNSCKKVEQCKNGGKVNNNTCECVSPFYGTSCERNMIDDLKGKYYLQYTSDPIDSCPNGVFEITITQSNLGENFVIVENIDNLGNNVIGKISAIYGGGTNPLFILSIERQIYGGGQIEATLRLNSDKISGSAEVYKNHFGSYPCGGTLTKKF